MTEIITERIEKTKVQKEMDKFVYAWIEAGKPIDEKWYDLFMRCICPNIESLNACNSGYCSMGDKDCSKLIEIEQS